MTDNQKAIISSLRAENYSYAFIAERIGLSANTVKSYCRRHSVLTPHIPRKTKTEKASVKVCRHCGNIITISDRSTKQFCSDHCRTAYWNKQRAAIAARAGEAVKSPAKPAERTGLPAPSELSLDPGEETAYGN